MSVVEAVLLMVAVEAAVLGLSLAALYAHLERSRRDPVTIDSI